MTISVVISWRQWKRWGEGAEPVTHANANWKGKRHSFLVSAYKCKCTDLCNFPKLSFSLPEEAFLKHISKLRCHISDKLLRVETLFAKSTFFQQPFLKSLKKIKTQNHQNKLYGETNICMLLVSRSRRWFWGQPCQRKPVSWRHNSPVLDGQVLASSDMYSLRLIQVQTTAKTWFNKLIALFWPARAQRFRIL